MHGPINTRWTILFGESVMTVEKHPKFWYQYERWCYFSVTITLSSGDICAWSRGFLLCDQPRVDKRWDRGCPSAAVWFGRWHNDSRLCSNGRTMLSGWKTEKYRSQAHSTNTSSNRSPWTDLHGEASASNDRVGMLWAPQWQFGAWSLWRLRRL